MGVGDKINYSGYIQSLLDQGYSTSAWRQSYDSDKIGGTFSKTLYFSAPAFHIKQNVYGSGLWGAHNGSASIYYLDSSDNWVLATTMACDEARGSGSDKGWNWYHNYNGGSSGDRPDIHIWKVNFYSHGDGKGRIRAYSGGIELLGQSWYDAHCYGKKIYGVPGLITENGYYPRDQYRGNKISIGSGTFRYICN